MKRINMILSGEGEPVEQLNMDSLPVETQSALNALETTLMMYPEMANDPEIKGLMEIRDAAIARQTPADTKAVDTPAATQTASATQTQTATNPLDSIPFFGGKTALAADFSKSKPEELASIAKDKLGIDTSQADWFPKFMSQTFEATTASQRLAKVEAEFKEINEGLDALPKELKESLRAYMDGKDWKAVFGGAVAIDYNADFAKLSGEEKIKVHNYLFPDDTIEAGANIEDKVVAKSLKAAESKFNSEKSIVKINEDKNKAKLADEGRAFLSSVDASFAAFKTEYPEFSQSELKEVENIIKRDGIATIYFDKNGNALPDAVKKLAFAINGEKVLTAAVAIARNKGASDGKAEVLQTIGGGGTGGRDGVLTKVTDEEKRVAEILKDSFADSQLTY